MLLKLFHYLLLLTSCGKTACTYCLHSFDWRMGVGIIYFHSQVLNRLLQALQFGLDS